MRSNNIVTGLLDFLKSDNQTELLPEISRELEDITAEMFDAKKVIVTSAILLSDTEKDELKKRLEKIFKREFDSIENIVNKKVIGGFKIQLGDILIDATVKGQLDKLTKTLLT